MTLRLHTISIVIFTFECDHTLVIIANLIILFVGSSMRYRPENKCGKLECHALTVRAAVSLRFHAVPTRRSLMIDGIQTPVRTLDWPALQAIGAACSYHISYSLGSAASPWLKSIGG